MRLRLVIALSLLAGAAACGQAPSGHTYTTPVYPTSADLDLARGDSRNLSDSSGFDGDSENPGWERPRPGDGSSAGDPARWGDGYGAGDRAGWADGMSYGDSRPAGDHGSYGDTSYHGDPHVAGDGRTGGDPAGTSGDVWLQIDYSRRSAGESTATADWSYSATPGFGEAEWAPASASWPYINTPDGGNLVSDPIGGTVLELGCYDRLRIFFGLEELTRVRSATVEVEGRSRATSASVDFEVWNPGASSSEVWTGSMSNDWTADVVILPFTAAAGDGFQAVEIAPTARSCDLAIRRVRVTLYDID